MMTAGQPHAEAAAPALARPGPSGWPFQPVLCDPLTMLDGRPVRSREMWTGERRPELLQLLQRYMYGTLPPRPELTARLERIDPAAFGGKAILSEVTLSFGPSNAPPIHLMVVAPNGRGGPAPVALALNYFGNHTLVHDPQVRLPDNWMPEWGGDGARRAKVSGHRASEAGRGSWADLWPIEDLLNRGYALATFYNGDVDPDTAEIRVFSKFFSAADPADQCGTIAAWAWGLQRAVDYLLTRPELDPRRIIVTGHSRTGKAALVAAAFDERIAMAIPHQAGCGGSAPSRARLAIGQPWNSLDGPGRKAPETVADINRAFPHWFSARYHEFNDEPERLPFDQHCLVALCAPRPVLFSNGRADTWINPAGQFAVLQAAANRWVRQVSNRFRTRSNLFLWTVANEFERYPDGKYQYDATDVDWARDVAAQIRQVDPVHLIACHPSVWITDRDTPGHGARPSGQYRGFTQQPLPVVWPLWEGSDLQVNLTQNNEGVQARTWGDVGAGQRGLTYQLTRWQNRDYPAEWTMEGWNFQAAGLEYALAEDWRRSSKPVINAEFGYQHEPGYENERQHLSRQCHHPDSVRAKAWKAALSGASLAVGFESTAVRNFQERDVINVRADAFQVLGRFIAMLPFWRMQPMPEFSADAVALAEPGELYALYLPQGGRIALDLPRPDRFWSQQWFNPRSGQFAATVRLAKAPPGSTFTAPNTDDWVLLLKRAD